MDTKKLPLEQLKVKSFVTVIESADQKTAKGGFVDFSYSQTTFNNNWTSIKTQRTPFGGGMVGVVNSPNSSPSL
jgi:hypothetical protein